jgi:hypothetical protein
MFVAGETVFRLCQLATEYHPVTFALEVPTEMLADIQEQSANIPNPDEILLVESVCNDESWTPERHAARQRAVKERYVAGLRTWKAYFESVERVIRPPENSHDPDS